MIGLIPKILLENMDKWKYENKKMVSVGTVTSDIQQAIDNQNKADTEFHFNPPFNITKADEDKRLVFGWALVSADKEGNELIDRQGDMVEPDDLEEGAYEYVLNFRDAGEEHIGTLRKKARMVESCVFTPEKMKAIGIPEGTIPVGWWIGFYVDDDRTWELIKSGHYKMFSIEGKAVREPIEDSQPHSMEKSVAKSFNEILKFNPYHDRLGRFTTGGGFMNSSYTGDPNTRAVTFSANPDTRAGAMAIARASSGNKAHPIIGQAYGGDTKVPPKQDKPKQAKPPKAKEPEKPDDPMRPKKLAGVEPGEPMDFDKADHGSTNPNYSKGGGYYVNCQTCVIANEARRRGYDVTARPKDTMEATEISYDQRKAWIDPKTGKNPDYMPGCRDVGTARQAKKYLDDNLKTGERYFLGHSWRGRSRSGHIITTFKDADGNVTLYDPQSGKKMTGSEVDSYLSRIKYKASSYGIKFNLGFRILRVDDKQFNTDYVDKILVKGGE